MVRLQRVIQGKPKFPPKRKLIIWTLTRVREAAFAKIRELDAAIERRKAERSAYQDMKAVKAPTPIDLRKKEDIMSVTKGACLRPDLYFKGHRACDLCSMHPWCLAPCKKLKIKGSQPEDKTKAYIKEQLRMESEASGVEIIRRGGKQIKLHVGRKSRIQLSIKR